MEKKQSKVVYSTQGQNTSWFMFFMGIFASWATVVRADEFPWWYKKLLSYHMSPWLIQCLQTPEKIVAIAGVVGCIMLLVKAFLAFKLIKKHRALQRLEAEHAANLLRLDQMKIVQAHQHTTIAHLSALVAHQSKEITRKS